MKFSKTKLKDAFTVTPQLKRDARGFFARVWCEKEFGERRMVRHLSQSSISFNRKKGTLRGMHYQVKPHAEAKWVRCAVGAIYDVIIDLRPTSPSFKKWVGVKLTAENRKTLYVPPGFAHGFITLRPNTEVLYQISAPYAPASARGIRWNDPAFGIRWPEKPRVLSKRDRSYPDFKG